ncbi:acyl-CoA dehydrogenase family protein [Agromyces albus]|uniref:acyl-CoA dehydrogenase family protein n=1 Tax=Agromyces albus TaxID=205332 RepID=UPI002783E1B2|nr:acyl-CoA dehydrogenase family protein [Agromyces albus]MDQ0574223.1 alkylation response protein AidB-like acyl-CoA dehydrogenase [Agromyces albus]
MTLLDDVPTTAAFAGRPPHTLAIPRVDLSDAALARLTAELAETAEEYDRTAAFPWRGIEAVHRAGVLTVGVGQRYGGHDASNVELVRLFEALGAGDPAVALIAAMTVAQHLAQNRVPFWPDERYRALLAESVERPRLLNAIRAEPEWGAPARGGLPATTIRRDGDGWLLSGRKGYATGSEGLAYHLVWAVHHDGASGEPELAHAIVPADAPGVRIERTWDHLGQRATSTHDVVYDDVAIPLEHFRGVALSRLDRPADARLHAGIGLAVSALYVGIGRAAQAFFVRFANERVPTSLGRAIATTERIQSVAGGVESELVQAEEVLLGVARRIDDGDLEGAHRAALAKSLATSAAIRAVEAAVAAIGNAALTRHHPLERHLRDVLAARVHPPQDDAALLAAGRRTLAAASARPDPAEASDRTDPTDPNDQTDDSTPDRRPRHPPRTAHPTGDPAS